MTYTSCLPLLPHSNSTPAVNCHVLP
uniref:Uncharacterized protein n=1 Tax=Anguilla anguilla TaxID=7936 RepID=A0A0E9SBS2_ANGAN